MFTKEEIETTVKVIKDVAGDPSVGAIKELIAMIENSGAATKEVRVGTVKETR